MTGEVAQHINRFFYNLSLENLADANKELKSVIGKKVDTIFNQEYEAVKNSFKKQ